MGKRESQTCTVMCERVTGRMQEGDVETRQEMSKAARVYDNGTTEIYR